MLLGGSTFRTSAPRQQLILNILNFMVGLACTLLDSMVNCETPQWNVSWVPRKIIVGELQTHYEDLFEQRAH